MLVRIALVLAVIALLPAPRAAAAAACAAQVGKLMSRDTEKLSTRYQRVAQRITKQGSNAKLLAEKCRIARALEPKLVEQIAALKQSGCSKDPEMGAMVVDIVRGHEGDLAEMRKTTGTACR